MPSPQQSVPGLVRQQRAVDQAGGRHWFGVGRVI